MSVWVENTHSSDMKFVVKNKAGFTVLEKTFYRSAVDRATGAVISNGYTELTNEEYELLKAQTATFSQQLKTKKLVVRKEGPNVSNPYTRLVDAKKEIEQLKAEIEALKGRNAGVQQTVNQMQQSETGRPNNPKGQQPR